MGPAAPARLHGSRSRGWRCHACRSPPTARSTARHCPGQIEFTGRIRTKTSSPRNTRLHKQVLAAIIGEVLRIEGVGLPLAGQFLRARRGAPSVGLRRSSPRIRQTFKIDLRVLHALRVPHRRRTRANHRTTTARQDRRNRTNHHKGSARRPASAILRAATPLGPGPNGVQQPHVQRTACPQAEGFAGTFLPSKPH